MTEEAREQATARLEEVLESTGARDPRLHCREILRDLKERDEDAYRRALRHFEEELTPDIASGAAEPLAAWRRFGLLMAGLLAEGRTVAVDPSGVAEEWEEDGSEGPEDRLILHLPDQGNERAVLVSLPAEPTPAQRATHDLLVRGKRTLPDA